MKGRRRAFTLVELLVVAGIIGLLCGLVLPSLSAARRRARQLQCMRHLQRIHFALSEYESDYDKYPKSVATIGSRGGAWNCIDPTTMVTYYEPYGYPHGHQRGISIYLYDYVDDPRVMYCPNTPKEYPNIYEDWKARDEWGYWDRTFGSYCFLWGYVGHTTERSIYGPIGSCRRRGKSKSLVIDMFVRFNWRSSGYASSEPFKESCGQGRQAQTAYFWYSLESNATIESLDIRTHAIYTDGRVEYLTGADMMPINAGSLDCGGPDIYGDIYIPKNHKN